MTPFSPRIHRALDLAGEAHDGQYRKDPDRKIPTLSHLAGVAYILAQHGWDEDTIVAGVLHDIDEDVVQKGKPEYEDMVRNLFGNGVYDLISYVTQQKKDENGQKIPWKIRGTHYAEKLKTAPHEARAISCADKIHNIECMLLAIERGQNIMAQLNAPADQQMQKFRELHEALGSGWSHPILDDFGVMIDKLKIAVEAYEKPR